MCLDYSRVGCDLTKNFGKLWTAKFVCPRSAHSSAAGSAPVHSAR